jgi:hypothetical protein
MGWCGHVNCINLLQDRIIESYFHIPYNLMTHFSHLSLCSTFYPYVLTSFCFYFCFWKLFINMQKAISFISIINVAAYYTSEAAVLLGAVSKAAILRSNMSLFSLSTRSHRVRIVSSSCFKLSICSCETDNSFPNYNFPSLSDLLQI